jgi:hypothetical protein
VGFGGGKNVQEGDFEISSLHTSQSRAAFAFDHVRSAAFVAQLREQL